jgi:hypothetical protein
MKIAIFSDIHGKILLPFKLLIFTKKKQAAKLISSYSAETWEPIQTSKILIKQR